MAQAPLEYLFGLEQFGIKFGLQNIRALVDGLGRPDRAYPVVHIAGTNGKGSVTAMVEAALRAAGYRTGRYTSPHLIDLTERFAIDGTPIEKARLETAADRIRDLVSSLLSRGLLRTQPTFFEATTAIALEIFRDARVDVAVCEVGLGGRLDATNILSPVVTAITSIGHDHTQYLGTTLAAIAAEKAGIIKTRIPVVVGDLTQDALSVVTAVAREQAAPVWLACEQTTVDDQGRQSSGGHRVRLRSAARDYGEIVLGLAGRHQIGNARVAALLLERLDACGMSVSIEGVREGLERVRWPGRLDRRQLADGRELLLDAAHNPEGAQALAVYLTSEDQTQRPLVFGAMKDKDVSPMLQVLAPCAQALVLTRAVTPRSADPADLAIAARSAGITCPVMVEPALPEALDAAWRISPRIVVAGSIFLLGDVMSHLGLS